MKTFELSDSVGNLVAQIRNTGSGNYWRGDSRIRAAVSEVFSDQVIAALPETAGIDALATAVTVSWIFTCLGEECFAAADFDPSEFNANELGGWGVSGESTEKLVNRCTEIYRSTSSSASVVSLAACIVLCLRSHDREALHAVRNNCVFLSGDQRRVAFDVASLSGQPDQSQVAWVGAMALAGARQRSWILRSLVRPANTHIDSRAVYLLAEFGYPMLWRSRYAQALSAALDAIFPYCLPVSIGRPAPVFDAEPFSEEVDWFFRQIVIDRLCTLWTRPSKVLGAWSKARFQVLLPFACYVIARAATSETKKLAQLLGRISLTERQVDWRNLRLRDQVRQIPNARRFKARLYSEILASSAVLGAAFAIPSGVAPDPLDKIIASTGLLGVIALIIRARRAVDFSEMLFPLSGSILASFVLASTFCAAQACVIWLLDGGYPTVFFLAYLVIFITLFFAVRYGTRFRIAPAAFVPEGLPDEVGDQVADQIGTLIGSAEQITWVQALRIRFFLPATEGFPAALGVQAEMLVEIQKSVQLLRLLYQANSDVYASSLAAVLNEVGAVLLQMKQWEEAKNPIMEAVRIRSSLTQANPRAYEASLAISLGNLALSLAMTNRLRDGLPVLEKAVEIYRRVARAGVLMDQVLFGLVLLNLGYVQSELGLYDQAISSTDEAAQIRRQLWEADPDDFGSDFADSLEQLGAILCETHRVDEALATTMEEVQIRRWLAAANHRIHAPALANSLLNASIVFSEGGLYKESLAAAEEAVRLYHGLASLNPAYRADLSNAWEVFNQATEEQQSADVGESASRSEPPFHRPAQSGIRIDPVGFRTGPDREVAALADQATAVTVGDSHPRRREQAFPDRGGEGLRGLVRQQPQRRSSRPATARTIERTRPGHAPPPRSHYDSVSKSGPRRAKRGIPASGLRKTLRLFWIVGAIACLYFPAKLLLPGPYPWTSVWVIPVGFIQIVGVSFCLYRAFRRSR